MKDNNNIDSNALDNSDPLIFDRTEIMKILPHRDPFLLIDQISECVPGKRASGVSLISEDDPVFEGHFPGYPVYPGVLIVEAMAQTGAVALLVCEKFKGKIALFAGIDKLRFRSQVIPPACLTIEVEIDKIKGPLGKGQGRAYIEDKLVAEGELLFAVQDRNS